jgi:hypothetical protein
MSSYLVETPSVWTGDEASWDDVFLNIEKMLGPDDFPVVF